MCGIAGRVGGPLGTEVLSQVLQTIQHRGPDGSGTWSRRTSESKEVLLGHRRLSILDVSEAGAQPMQDDTGQYCITYNGELYNYVELHEELLDQGVTFRSSCDTEVILQAYRAWGDKCLGKMNGMFSFAIYDERRGVLFCARDRYGEKPFLYHATPQSFTFASEYKALLLCPGVPCEVEEIRLVQAAVQSSKGLDADTDTVFRGIKQLRPGEALELDLRTLEHRTWQYWRMPEGGELTTRSEADAFEEFRELLVDSVRIRMRSDVTVGSCLSGGLDSSAIVCIVRHVLGHSGDYHTFTGRFPGTSADEWSYAEQVVNTTGVCTHVVEPNVDGFLDELPQFVWGNELPVASSSQYAQWCVFRLAKEHRITVLLDGQGADEALGGYEQYFMNYVASLEQRGEVDRLAREVPQIRARYPLALPSSGRALRDKLPFRLRHWLSNRFGVGSAVLYGLRPDVAAQLLRQQASTEESREDSLRAALRDDTFGGVLTTLLRYGDRNSMAHSREVRLPFCDHRIAEFVATLPPHILMGEIQTKRLLRESMRGIIPEGIRTRWNKHGFRPPQDLWFQSPRLLEQAKESLHSREFEGQEMWLAEWWQRALERIESGELRLGWELFQPLMIGWWREHFLVRIRAERAQLGIEA